jgi:hypothetical protein
MRPSNNRRSANSDPIPVKTARAALPAIVAASHDNNSRVRMFAIQVAAGIDLEGHVEWPRFCAFEQT